MIKIDHFYITVTDLDKAIDFYQKLLGRNISNREKNRWADACKEANFSWIVFDKALWLIGSKGKRTDDILGDCLQNIGAK